MTHDKQRLVILRHSPQSGNALREGLDTALVAAAFGQPVSLLFLGEGILALTSEQGSVAPGQKPIAPTIDMLEMYDIDQLLVPIEELERLGLASDDLIEGVTVLSEGDVARRIQGFDTILNF